MVTETFPLEDCTGTGKRAWGGGSIAHVMGKPDTDQLLSTSCRPGIHSNVEGSLLASSEQKHPIHMAPVSCRRNYGTTDPIE